MTRRQLAAAALGAALVGLLAPQARAGDLPPPEIRPAVRRATPVSRPLAERPRPTAGLPYRPPYSPARSVLPVSSPHRARSVATRTYVPPAPGAPAPRWSAPPAPPHRIAAEPVRRPALPPPSVSRGLPMRAPPVAAGLSRRLGATASTRPRPTASVSHGRTSLRRTTTRRPAPRACTPLTVPPAPGYRPVITGVRRTLPLTRPPGCTDDG